MDKKNWVKKIKSECEDAKTYKPYFDSVIDTLAQILETRDAVHQQYIDEGCKPTIIVTTDRSGKENIHKNPLISMEVELNAQALKYWSELGLTASSFKKLNISTDNDGGLEAILSKLADGKKL